MIAWIQSVVAEEGALGLLEPVMHLGDLVHDKQDDVMPLLLQLSEGIPLELVLPSGIRKTWKLEQDVFAPKPILKAATPV